MEKETNTDYRYLLSADQDSKPKSEIRVSKSGQRNIWHTVALDQGHGSNSPGKRTKEL